MMQEQLRKSLVARIANKLEEGDQGQLSKGSTRLPSALSPSRSRAQFEDTIPGEPLLDTVMHLVTCTSLDHQSNRHVIKRQNHCCLQLV